MQRCAKHAKLCKMCKNLQNVQKCVKCAKLCKLCKTVQNVQSCGKCAGLIGLTGLTELFRANQDIKVENGITDWLTDWPGWPVEMLAHLKKNLALIGIVSLKFRYGAKWWHLFCFWYHTNWVSIITKLHIFYKKYKHCLKRTLVLAVIHPKYNKVGNFLEVCLPFMTFFGWFESVLEKTSSQASKLWEAIM